MSVQTFTIGGGPLATLKQFVRTQADRMEACEMCATGLSQVHSHLLELAKSRVLCACEPCAILFGGSTKQQYRRIPRDCRRLTNFDMEDGEWDSLLIPIKLAFFTYASSPGRVIAQYPSPGGVLESSLDLEYWSVIVEKNPILIRFQPDVEALLVNRIQTEPQYFRAPIDRCYELVGLIRKHWRGLSGGSEVWMEIDRFFDDLRLATGENCA